MNEELKDLKGVDKEDDEATILSNKANKSQMLPANGNNQEREEMKSIFDKIEELDNFLAMEDNDNDMVSEEMSAGIAAQDVEVVNGKNALKEGAKYGSQSEVVAPVHFEGIKQSIDEIENDFPGICFATQLQEKDQKAAEETKTATPSPPEHQQEVQRQPQPPQQHSLAKSEYIPTKSTTPLLVEAPEYHDNEFWNIKKSQLL